MSTNQVAEAVVHNDLVHQTSSESILAVIVFTSGEMLTGTLRGIDEQAVRLSVAWHVSEPTEYHFDRDSVAELFFVNGRVRYLSGMTPASVKQTPYFSYVAPCERNTNALGGPLSIAARFYPRGLGCHSKTEAVYELNGRYQFFRSDIGLDGRLGAGGDAEFKVFLDSVASEPVFRAHLGGEDDPRSTGSIDVSQSQRLVLVVDYAAGGSVRDFATWGNALLVEKPRLSEENLNNE